MKKYLLRLLDDDIHVLQSQIGRLQEIMGISGSEASVMIRRKRDKLKKAIKYRQRLEKMELK